MCGIVGLFAKTKSFENELGFHFSKMLEEMTDRGPDSAGCAMYHNVLSDGHIKIVVLSRDLLDSTILADKLSSVFSESLCLVNFTISMFVSLIESLILDILQRISSVVSILSVSYQIIIFSVQSSRKSFLNPLNISLFFR